ncbi:MAG: GNAT family N-acetyltransferase [Pseudomonadota bacterium]
MQIRKANSNDDIHRILELIYATDEYIYPALMDENDKDYTYLLAEQGMYHYNNITLAIVDDAIAGILISFTNEAAVPRIAQQQLQEYFYDLQNSFDSQSEYINNVSVRKEYRGMGIATKLISYIETHTTMPKIVLDCLVENKNALHLYEKLGFTVTGIHPAFCLDPSLDIKDARMEKVL